MFLVKYTQDPEVTRGPFARPFFEWGLKYQVRDALGLIMLPELRTPVMGFGPIPSASQLKDQLDDPTRQWMPLGLPLAVFNDCQYLAKEFRDADLPESGILLVARDIPKSPVGDWAPFSLAENHRELVSGTTNCKVSLGWEGILAFRVLQDFKQPESPEGLLVPDFTTALAHPPGRHGLWFIARRTGAPRYRSGVVGT